MPSYKNIPKETVLKAINASYGIISTVAARLSCDWGTADRLIKRWAETKEAFRAETESILDLAEGKVIKAINDGDIATTKWYLAKKGKTRGYEDTPTIKLDNDEPLNIQFAQASAETLLQADNVEVNSGENGKDETL